MSCLHSQHLAQGLRARHKLFAITEELITFILSSKMELPTLLEIIINMVRSQQNKK